jgi:hypothetical protein
MHERRTTATIISGAKNRRAIAIFSVPLNSMLAARHS